MPDPSTSETTQALATLIASKSTIPNDSVRSVEGKQRQSLQPPDNAAANAAMADMEMG